MEVADVTDRFTVDEIIGGSVTFIILKKVGIIEKIIYQ